MLSVKPSHHFVVRIDGVAFRTFTNGLETPFDSRITAAMLRTTVDLVKKFNATTGYTQSDEISLVFPAVDSGDSDRIHLYNGRLQKLVSVMSSYAAARLNYHLSFNQWEATSETVRSRMLSHTAYFDSRVVILPDEKWLMDILYWRSNFDGIRNSISHVSQSLFAKKDLHKKSVRQQLQMISSGRKIDIIQQYGLKNLFGSWVKKEQVEMTSAFNPKTGQPVLTPVLRTRIRSGSFNWAEWSEMDRIRFTVDKYWGNGPSDPPKDPLDYIP